MSLPSFLVAGHNLHDYDGLLDGLGEVLSVTESRGYLLNHGRRRYAFLINVQVHNAKTASATTVAIADKAKVYILIMPISIKSKMDLPPLSLRVN